VYYIFRVLFVAWMAAVNKLKRLLLFILTILLSHENVYKYIKLTRSGKTDGAFDVSPLGGDFSEPALTRSLMHALNH